MRSIIHRQKKITACVSQQLGSSISAMHFCVHLHSTLPRGPPDCGFHAGLCWGQSLGLRKWYFPHLHSSESPPPAFSADMGRPVGLAGSGEERRLEPSPSAQFSGVSQERHTPLGLREGAHLCQAQLGVARTDPCQPLCSKRSPGFSQATPRRSPRRRQPAGGKVACTSVWAGSPDFRWDGCKVPASGPPHLAEPDPRRPSRCQSLASKYLSSSTWSFLLGRGNDPSSFCHWPGFRAKSRKGGSVPGS